MSSGFSDFFYSSTDGLELHARVYGEANSGTGRSSACPA